MNVRLPAGTHLYRVDSTELKDKSIKPKLNSLQSEFTELRPDDGFAESLVEMYAQMCTLRTLFLTSLKGLVFSFYCSFN